jgi:hypothetical protein
MIASSNGTCDDDNDFNPRGVSVAKSHGVAEYSSIDLASQILSEISFSDKHTTSSSISSSSNGGEAIPMSQLVQNLSRQHSQRQQAKPESAAKAMAANASQIDAQAVTSHFDTDEGDDESVFSAKIAAPTPTSKPLRKDREKDPFADLLSGM